MTINSNQLHGKTLEDVIKSTFPGSADSQRPVNAKFDIEASFDKNFSLNTSIKVSKGDTIGMADARGFWKLSERFRLVVCNYKQVGGRKSFNKIYEIIFTEEMLNDFKGDLDFSIIEDFHESIKTFPVGKHKEARDFAKNKKAELLEKHKFAIILNPKIDSKNQRRLQCSLSLRGLIEKYPESVKEFTDTYRGLVLPIVILSEKRKFNQ